MIECSALDIQDQLPDYVAGRLDGASVRQVVTHLDLCAACRRDAAVLHRVRSSASEAPVIDTARITAAVIAASATDAHADHEPFRPTLRVVDGTASRARLNTPVVQRSSWRSAWRRTTGWQMAAALTLVVSGVMATTMARRGGSVVDVMPNRDSLAPAMVATTTSAERGPSVSYGDLSDYSEGELETMLATLEGWDGAARVEPASFEPVVVPVGGGR